MIGLATHGKFGGAVNELTVVQGTSEFVVDPTSLSFEAIYNNLKAWIDGRPDSASWVDFFASSVGVTNMELLAGMSTFLAYRVIASRRETYLQYAENKSSSVAIASQLGYSVDRGTNAHITMTVTPASTVILEKYTVVGSVKEKDLILLSDVGFVSGTAVQIEVIVGDKKSESLTVSSSALQWFRFSSANVSEDFRLLLNDVEITNISSVVKDLIDNKYVALSNSFGAIDVTYLNAVSPTYSSGDVLKLEYAELAAPTFVDGDITFDYGIVTSVDSTVAAVSGDTNTGIRVNAPLHHETQLLIRGRLDYEKTFKQLDSRFADTNGYDTSPAVIDLTYVLNDLTFLSTLEKNNFITQLSNFRPFGVQPPTISDPIRVYLALNISIVLQVPAVTAQVQSDVNTIIASYESVLEKLIDLEAIENSLEDKTYTKIARVTLNTSTWVVSTYYSRGSFVTAIVDTGLDYEATAFSSSVSADILLVPADDILNDEGFSLIAADGTTTEFKFSKDSGAVTGQDVTISITSGQTDVQVAALVLAAINTQPGLSAALSSPSYVVTVVRKEGGAANRGNSESVTNSTFSVSDYEGRKSSSSEPIWPTTAGDTVVDNDITWTARTRLANPGQLAWDEYADITTTITIT